VQGQRRIEGDRGGLQATFGTLAKSQSLHRS
jgi:hypothetical protein